MPEQSIQKELVAVIDIGSSAIRMVIAEVGPKTEIRTLENLQKPVRFGKDVFKTGRISTGVMREGLRVLSNYKSIIDGYGIHRVNAIATSALREASNRDNMVDRIFVRTGIDVEVIESAEENRLELIAVEHALKGKIDFDKRQCLIIEVGTGHTEIILLNKGEVTITRALPLGSIRLPAADAAGKTDSANMQKFLKRSIQATVQEAGKEFSLNKVDTLVAVGGDMRVVARSVSDKAGQDFTILDKKSFLDFLKSISRLTPEEIASKYGLSYEESEMFYPSLLIYQGFLDETQAEDMIIPTVSIRDGLLIEVSQLLSGYKRTDLTRQVTNSARSLGKKYDYDEPHALCVTDLALKLFDQMKEDHGLSSRDRLLLEVAGILHDIGTYISATSHHKHSAYLVDAAEIFGLRKADKDIVSNVVRYHRRSVPKPTHVGYMSLPRADRSIVAKLSAILRVADALDRSHQQKIRDLVLEKDTDVYTIWLLDDVGDIAIERQGVADKSDMFTDIFGASVLLKQGTPPKNR